MWLPPLAPEGKPHPKAWEVFNCYERYVCVSGGRRSGKTLAVAHKAWRHLWDTPGARVALFAKTVKNAKQGGVWEDVLNVVGKAWLESGIVGECGLPIAFTTKDGSGTPGPRSDPQTRSVFFKIRNRHGSESEMILFSLDDVNEVEAKVRGGRFSMIWFTELDNFPARKVFNITVQQLRMLHLPFEAHQWIADTNPAKEGIESWIYKLWWEERCRKDHREPDFQKQLRLIEVMPDDNPWLGERELSELRGSYADDPLGYRRYVEGKWVSDTDAMESIYADLLTPKHLPDGAIDVASDTTALFTGWDIGSVNNSFHIMEKRIVAGVSVWLVLDEVVAIKEEISTGEFTLRALEKMRALERHYGRPFKWTHWSDSTALTFYRPGVDGYDATEVLKASNGEINLMAAEKPSGSVRTCTRMIRRLLIENRLFIGSNCPRTVDMLREIRWGKNGIIRGHHEHSHDSFRYPVYMEERQDLLNEVIVTSSERTVVSHA